MFIDLLFPAVGDSVPLDHAYPLYAALTQVVPSFHDVDGNIRFAPLNGMRGEPGRLQLKWSRLRVRLPDDMIRTVLPLAGKKLDVAGASVRLGPPTVQMLTPATTVESWLVTFKHGEEPEPFLITARAKLAELGIAGKSAIRAFESGPRTGQPRRRVVRVKGQKIVGFALVVAELSAEESIRLQEQGLGGRTRMGCGFFLPHRPRSS